MSHHCVKYEAGKNKQYRRYIKMCEKAKEIQESHIFKEGDCIFHPREGVLEVLKIRNDRITATPEREVNCPISECTWLPTEEEIKEIIRSYIVNLAEDILDIFLDDDKMVYGYKWRPKIFFRTCEEQWLAYYMSEIHNKRWLFKKQEWDKYK
ncbi:hypothetical protein ES703_111424 [subsurface metagenome]